MLIRVEPDDPSFEQRIYFCAHCADYETVVAPA